MIQIHIPDKGFYSKIKIIHILLDDPYSILQELFVNRSNGDVFRLKKNVLAESFAEDFSLPDQVLHAGAQFNRAEGFTEVISHIRIVFYYQYYDI